MTGPDHTPVVIRPVDGIVKLLGAALVVAVGLLVFVMWGQRNSLDAFTGQQARSDQVRSCLSQVAADVDRVAALRDIRHADSVAAGFELVVLSSDLREHPPVDAASDPRLVQARELTKAIGSNAAAAHAYNGRITRLTELRTQSPTACTADTGYRLPADLLIREP
jgi:hypothetical protein